MNRAVLRTNSPNVTEGDTELAVAGSETDQTTAILQSRQYQWTDEEQSETIEESEVLSDVEEILTETAVSFTGEVGTDVSESSW